MLKLSILILCSFLNAISIMPTPTTQPNPTIKTEKTENPFVVQTLDHYPKPEIEITDASDTYNCRSRYSFHLCEPVKRFYVDNATINCYQERIGIMFDTSIMVKDQIVAVSGFLRPYGFENQIEPVQMTSKLCKLIRR